MPGLVSGKQRPVIAGASLLGCSAAWLARLPWVQEAAGSNPVTPTSVGLPGSYRSRAPA
jgi:hypothetical protein